MVSEELFELCQPVLQNAALDDEEQTEQLEDLLRSNTTLTGASLENAVLDILWRQRNQSKPNASPPTRHTIIRRSSPAPWQVARSATPMSSPSMTGTSPAGISSFHLARPVLTRGPRSSTASPFTSPRPSPRLAFAQPIPHSPSLNAYEFSEQHSPTSELYGDMGSESNVEWLVGDDQLSVTSSIGALSASAPEFVPDMSPHDILRSVLGDRKSNDEIEAALEANSYDLGATIAALSETPSKNGSLKSDEGRVLVGKSMAVDHIRPATPPSQTRTPVVCKYWLSTGTCLRADCRFSHDLTNHICKYWMMGNCLAGDGCPFSHDPTGLVGNLSISNNSQHSSVAHNNFQFDNNQEAFPALQASAVIGEQPWTNAHMRKYPNHVLLTNPAGATSPLGTGRRSAASRPQSRPTSRHQQRDMNPSPLSVDDPEAFPALSAMTAKGQGKKHHGKRGGHNKEPASSSLADVVRIASPGPGKGKNGKTGKEAKTRELTAAAMAIPAPQNIPWLETGPRANQQYIKYRTDAIRHGTVRNKFLQSAAQAWNRNDARAAKALSLRGQAENEAMRRCHREAARQLYEEREKHLANGSGADVSEELYVDLHGLHPEEAVKYLDQILVKHSNDHRILYAITGTGHHSKNGKDKVGKAVKVWLNELKYVFREFSVPGERGGYVGGVLGIDPAAYDKEAAAKWHSENDGQSQTSGDGQQPVLSMGSIQLLKRADNDPSEK